MIPTINEILSKYNNEIEVYDEEIVTGTAWKTSTIKKMLKDYGILVVEECQQSFIYEYDCSDEHDAVIIVDQDSVNAVKEQIK